jgi:16S rRNA (guanine527-N7)-methyltransferase
VTVEVPDGAREQLGDAFEPILRYADLLLAEAVPRGLLGPHEAPRLWDRHLLNSAAVAALLPPTGSVVDLGSGAGLPGVVLALCIPTLEVTLLDATRRRTDFLTEVVDLLALGDRVRVVWGRAEALPPLRADVVVARAVAPLSRLAGWALPHLKPGGTLLAMKGESAAEELQRDRTALGRLGVESASLVTVGSDDEPVRVVRLIKGADRRSAVKARPQRATRPAAGGAVRRRLPRPDAQPAAEKE